MKLPLIDHVVKMIRMPPYSGNKTHDLEDWLRSVCRKFRQSQEVPFYPMRSVANLFGMSLADVSRAYRKLNDEGLLLVRRSQPTLLCAADRKPLHVPRSVVAIPVWLYAFTQWADWRRFFTGINDSLRDRNIATDMIFLDKQDMSSNDFKNWLVGRKPDYLILFGLHPHILHHLLVVRDYGTHVIHISTAPVSDPVTQFILTWQTAFLKALVHLRRKGYKKISILLPENEELALWIKDSIVHVGMTYTIHLCPRHQPEKFHDYLITVAPQSDHVLFSPNEDWLQILGKGDLLTLVELFKSHCWLTLHRLSIPAPLIEDIEQFHLVAHDWKEITQKIADAISTNHFPDSKSPIEFEARFYPNTDPHELNQAF